MSPRPEGDFVRSEIARALPSSLRLLSRLNLWRNRTDNGLCQLLLQLEDILQHAVVALCPNLITGERIDQLARHTYSIRRLADAAFQHIPNAEFLPDLLNVGRLTFVRER